MFNTPILFLIFNRPDTTQKVFERIREIKPKQLFIAADGPREGNECDKINCKAARAIASHVDWDCEVNTFFREENLGCGLAVSKAITWFFDQVEEGIILEDDVLPDLSFFFYCKELLNYYKHDKSIMHIGGANFQEPQKREVFSYYFSNLPCVWGWATWKRAWEKFSYDVSDYLDFIEGNHAEKIFPNKQLRENRRKILQRVHLNEIDTWDYRWSYSIWKQRGISIVPSNNLVLNVGFNVTATHTKGENPFAKIPVVPLPGIIRHPKVIRVNKKADEYCLKTYYSISKVEVLSNKLKYLLLKIFSLI